MLQSLHTLHCCPHTESAGHSNMRRLASLASRLPAARRCCDAIDVSCLAAQPALHAAAGSRVRWRLAVTQQPGGAWIYGRTASSAGSALQQSQPGDSITVPRSGRPRLPSAAKSDGKVGFMSNFSLRAGARPSCTCFE